MGLPGAYLEKASARRLGELLREKASWVPASAASHIGSALRPLLPFWHLRVAADPGHLRSYLSASGVHPPQLQRCT